MLLVFNPSLRAGNLLPVLVLGAFCVTIQQVEGGLFGSSAKTPDEILAKFNRKYAYIVDGNNSFSSLKSCIEHLGKDIVSRSKRQNCLAAALLGKDVPEGKLSYEDFQRLAHSTSKFRNKIGGPCSKLQQLRQKNESHISAGVIPNDRAKAVDFALSMCKMIIKDNKDWEFSEVTQARRMIGQDMRYFTQMRIGNRLI